VVKDHIKEKLNMAKIPNNSEDQYKNLIDTNGKKHVMDQLAEQGSELIDKFPPRKYYKDIAVSLDIWLEGDQVEIHSSNPRKEIQLLDIN